MLASLHLNVGAKVSVLQQGEVLEPPKHSDWVRSERQAIGAALVVVMWWGVEGRGMQLSWI